MESSRLKSWYEAYDTEDDHLTSPYSEAVQAVMSDQLDQSQVELRIETLRSSVAVLGNFCIRCQYLLQHWPTSPRSGRAVAGSRFSSIELEAAARNGCRFCAFVFTRLVRSQALTAIRKVEARMQKLQVDAPISLAIRIGTGYIFNPQTLWFNFPGKFSRHCDSGWAVYWRSMSYVLPPSLPSWHENLDTFEVAAAWLQQCYTAHKSCGLSSGADRVRPTRLVDIKDPMPRLVTTADWVAMPLYATLSYCWGTQKFLMLTRDNLAAFFKGIALESMPVLFRDAIFILRKLGLEYVWIDALCIIQGESDLADWNQEASRMSSVYGGSHVNLAASSATSVYQGLFDKLQHHSEGFYARVTAVDSTTGAGRYCVNRNFHSMMVYEEATSRTHIASRAWTLQEKLLAPRTLSIGSSGTFWECRDTTASEFLPDGFHGKPAFTSVRQPQGWSHIVSIYTAASLTYGSDRLPALSGIASRQAQLTGDDYLAGMWRRELVTQLEWIVTTPRSRPQWRAPSWSWMSVDGQIRLTYSPRDNSEQSKRYAKVKDVRIDHVGPGIYGPVSGGVLTLACSAMIRGRMQGHMLIYDRIDSGSPEIHVNLNHIDVSDEDSEHAVLLLPLYAGRTGVSFPRPRSVTSNHSTEDGEDQGDSDEEDEEEEEQEEEEEFFDEFQFRGLILEPCESTPGTFTRIGSFDLRGTPYVGTGVTSEDFRWHQLVSLVAEKGPSVAEEVCREVVEDSEMPDARYVIDIV